MIVDVQVPTPGESITEVEIGSWLVENGAVVEKDQEIAEVESDKATLTIVASESGKVELKAEEGETIEVGAVVCTIDTSVAPEPKNREDTPVEVKAKKEERTKAKKETTRSGVEPSEKAEENEAKPSSEYEKIKVTPVAKELMKERGLSVDDVVKGLKRLGKKEVEAVEEAPGETKENSFFQTRQATRDVDKKRMTSLRKKLSERMVSVKNETAMLTTFNEVDMSNIMALRKKYQNLFIEKHGFKLGFMSFFTKAVALAMDSHPMINAQIDGGEIVSPRFVDVGVAVSTPKGLMVPVVRNAESKTISQIELEIKELAEKARNKKISVKELSGGTFTITNGGVFGSLLSTPIINPPQSAILGMHNIQERPVVADGQVVIRPMMYVALSYDHRVIDGKDSVGFLVKIKEMLENPGCLFTGGQEPERLLLGV
jgi:2-oxoglutarate dehydrogenase E2 component (dihydrolipoamide succinyltransferase)